MSSTDDGGREAASTEENPSRRPPDRVAEEPNEAFSSADTDALLEQALADLAPVPELAKESPLSIDEREVETGDGRQALPDVVTKQPARSSDPSYRVGSETGKPSLDDLLQQEFAPYLADASRPAMASAAYEPARDISEASSDTSHQTESPGTGPETEPEGAAARTTDGDDEFFARGR